MKSKRFIKETIKTENVPQEQESNVVISHKYKSHALQKGNEQVTVKETTIEKSYKKTYNKTEEESHKISNTSSSMKQGISSGLSSEKKSQIQNNKEETGQNKLSKYNSKYSKYKSMRKEKESIKEIKYSKKEIELIIKIQRWWKRVLARINGYKIREKLKKEKINTFSSKNREVVREKYSAKNNISSHKIEAISNNNNNKSTTNKNTTSKNISTNNYKINNNNNKNNITSVKSNTSSYSNININSYSSTNNIQKNQNSKSYTNINNINSNVKKNLNINANITSSSSQNNIQTMSKKIEHPQYIGSISTSPSIKNKYIIETKKVEYFKKPKNYSVNKTLSKNTVTSMSEINRYEVKEIMQQIWNEESYCSTVESLCCLSEEKNNTESQNNAIIFEEYEEEIRRLKTLLIEKDQELNNLMANLNSKENQLNMKYTSTYKEYNSNQNEKNINEMQLISKRNWNEVNLPSPVSEIFIKSFIKNLNSEMAYNMEKYSQKIKEESMQETISDSEAVLEIQEMNSLSIISNIKKPKNICQHLQSLMILSKKNEEEDQFIFQKIEEINITSIINKQRNSIQELDGLEIISMKKPQIKKEYNIMIQELDGLEILKSEKLPNSPQCVDEFEIPREYDMLLVKPSWNNLQIQGSGINLLSIPRDIKLENQEIDEFEIISKKKIIQNIQIGKIESIELIGKEKEKEEYVPIKRKGFVEKINKTVITKKEEKKEEIKPIEKKPLEIKNISNIEIKREYETIKPIVLEKIDWNKMTRPIKSTKLIIHGIIPKEKEKEELVTENFAFNIAETNKRFKKIIIYENGGFDIEGNKGMILKEGPAQTIQIKKEQILLPSKNERFDLINEIKKPELIIANENRIQINGQYEIKMDSKENIKIIEKIIEKKINWNEFNIIEHNDLIISQQKPEINLIKQISSIITLLGEEIPQPQKEIKEKIIKISTTKDWNDLLKIQRFAKFGLLGKPKQKKYKLLVANGDKFFIQKESDDEIIYNDDYNTRKQKKKSEKKEKSEIIKEKEIIPRYQREIRAQIAKVKESESETSSLSEIDVLAGIRNKSVIGVGGAEKDLLRLNGYETKILNGEVIFTSKNDLGINLGGSQYQKQFKKRINYSKKLTSSASTNKMTGIEINFNPKIKNGIKFEKMSATSGIITEGNYKIFSEKNGGQINGQNNIILNNKLTGQKSASNLLIRKRESGKSNETPISVNINNEMNKQIKIGNIIFNSKKNEKGINSPISTKENEKRIVMSGDERLLNEKKKNVEIKFKKSKVKNVEPLRDFESQNSY